MRRNVIRLLSTALAVALLMPNTADGFQLPGLSKKRGKSSKRVTARVGDEPPQSSTKSTGWSMPSFQLPKWQLPAPKVPFVSSSKTTRSTAHKHPAKPKMSTWSRVKRGTSNFVDKTTSFLMPWKKGKAASAPSARPQKKKSAFSLTGWLPGSGSKPKSAEKSGPTSVREFMALPRVGDRKDNK